MGGKHASARFIARGRILHVDGRFLETVENGVIITFYVNRQKGCIAWREQAGDNRYFMSAEAYGAILRQVLPDAKVAAINAPGAYAIQ